MNTSRVILLLGALVWFGAIYWLATGGTFISSAGQPPMAVGIAFLTPLLLFLASLSIPGWRAVVLAIPPVFLIALNGWRFIGLGFLMAYQENLLPGGFAWPTGLGDIAMAVTAPWIAARVASDDRFRFGKTFLVWNLLGIADFVDAVLLGTLINTALMQRLPFVLIPCFFVPLVAMAHITLLVQRRRGPG
jgi:hypothetical protein